LLQSLDDAVGVDHQCLHRSSVYHLTRYLQDYGPAGIS
jgi:hypothetical protein